MFVFIRTRRQNYQCLSNRQTLAKVIAHDDKVQYLSLAFTERAGGLEVEVFEKAHEYMFVSVCQNRYCPALVLQLPGAGR